MRTLADLLVPLRTGGDNFFAAVTQTTGTKDAEQLAAEAMAAWSAVHGIAVLWLQGNLPSPPTPRRFPKVVAQLGIGLRTVAVASTTYLVAPS